MNVFATKWFGRWARRNSISDPSLCEAIMEMERGLIDADMGGSLYKKRVGAAGRGKSGSYRTLVAFKRAEKAFFIYGFEKKERANIDKKEEKALKALAEELLGYDKQRLRRALKARELRELECDDDEQEA
jgi:hypothetical protein